MEKKERLLQLDGIRGLAALMVLVFHFFCRALETGLGSAPAYVARALSWTWSGVDLFFVLSGFLITGILLDNVRATNYFGVFYLRRVCRIFPLYFATIGFFVLCGLFLTAPKFQWLSIEGAPIWSYLTFTQNFVMAFTPDHASWLGITWSIAVEEHFYLVLPLLIYMLPSRWLPWLLVTAIGSAVVLRGLSPSISLATLGTPWRADSLLTGSLLAWGLRQPGIAAKIKANVPKIRVVFWACVLATGVLIAKGPTQGGALDHFCLALLYATLILMAVLREDWWLTKLLRWRPLVWLGTLSYGIYLLHYPAAGLIFGALRGTQPMVKTWSDGGLMLLATLLTLVMAAASFYLVEKRIINFGHKFRYTSGAGPAEKRSVPREQLAGVG